METATDAPAIRVGSGHLGRGVFATRAIAAEETIEVCPTLELADSDVSGTLGDYVLKSAYDEDVVILMFGYGMLYNHATDPNAEYREHADGIAFVALRALEAGEEITISYGDEWWQTRDLTPD
jgi:SET domain-containing protein